MDADFQFQHDRIVVRRDFYNAGVKNQGGAAFNIINLNYDGNPAGNRLK